MSNSLKIARSAGILLHPTSLPGPYGIGDLGPEAFRFVDFLVDSGQTVWQMLPVCPPARHNSPYSALSAFAGNPLLIDLTELLEHGLLDKKTLNSSKCDSRRHEVDFEKAALLKAKMLRQAFICSSATHDPELELFKENNCYWLDDYALFVAISDNLSQSEWPSWSLDLRRRSQFGIEMIKSRFMAEIGYVCFVQYTFFRQWGRLKRYANERGVRLFGDIAMFVDADSADVWRHQELFELDGDGRPKFVAGVPPDKSSVHGQIWGTPLYRWVAMREQGFKWWIERCRHASKMFDILRLDHFRGFLSCWAIRSDFSNAAVGQWLQAPGNELFDALTRELPTCPFVAEDWGGSPQGVDDLRRRFGFASMLVIQHVFDNPSEDWLRQLDSENVVVYTGTHDNDTSVGWFKSRGGFLGESAASGKSLRSPEFLPVVASGLGVNWDLLRVAYHSRCTLAIAPLQDVIGLDTESRMNTPGIPGGNWKWRFRYEMLNTTILAQLAELTEDAGRLNTGCP